MKGAYVKMLESASLRALRHARVTSLAISVLACSGDEATDPPPSSTVQTVVVAPSAVTLDRVGATQQLTATAIDQQGAVMQAALTWSSTNQAIVSVTSTGLTTAVAPGTAFVTATASGVTGSAKVDVVVPPIAVVILSATQTPVDIGVSRVTVSLRNNGGGGFYRLEFWSIPVVPNGPSGLLYTSEPVDVGIGYAETASWRVPTGSVQGRVYWILAYSRPAGSAVYSQTSRFDFP